ncbi:hypothetical protein O0L34_g14816 [Tuta absoluta]|nr:hypothetical protein O0L34_g14816 [Tuta absoluta]
MRCNAPDLRDNVYLTTPSQMARTTLKTKNASEEQIEIIRQCIDKLSGMGEVVTLRERGFNVNGLLFNADEEYRTETIYRVARSPEKEHLELACSLAAKYKLDPLEVWMQHAENDLTLSHLTKDTLPFIDENTHSRVREGLWPQISGDNHNSLIKYFALLKNIDEKPVICGLTAQEHIKLLKKAKAASPDLDYKLLLEQPSAEKFSAHILEIIKPENVGLLTKFLRSLPPAFKVPISVNAIYTMWLTKYFFSVGSAGASNKKWMQQYRQCASYFNKLGKDDLLEFVTNTCFTLDAIDRVPPGTRNLMIMQAVDYCQQEQENDFKFNKNEQTWAQVGQELTRWARFLENFHSTTIQNIIQHSNVAKDQIWPDIEMSHGETNKIIECMSRLLLEGELKPPAMATLLQCLHVSANTHRVFEHVVNTGVSHTRYMILYGLIIECMSRLLLEGELKPPAMATLLQCLHVSANTHRVFEHVVNNGVSHTRYMILYGLIIECMSRLLLEGELKPPAMATLLQCLHVSANTHRVFEHVVNNGVRHTRYMILYGLIIECMSRLLLEGELKPPAMATLLQCLHVSANTHRVFEHVVNNGVSHTRYMILYGLIIECMSRLLLEGELKPPAMATLLQCLHVSADTHRVFEHVVNNGVSHTRYMILYGLIIECMSRLLLEGELKPPAMATLLQCLHVSANTHRVFEHVVNNGVSHTRYMILYGLIIECMSRLLLEGELKPPAMATLLQCLHVSADTHRVFEHVVNNGVSHTSDIELLVTRLTQYHKDGVRFSEDLLDKVMMLATEHGLPPHKQISLLSLSQRERVHDTGDMLKIAQYTIDLFRNEWPELEYAQGLHEEKLTTDEGRREVFSKFLVVTDTWQRKKALVDVLVCWPPTKDAGQHSLHFEYLQYLLNASDRRESLVLIKLLLGRPVLNEEEVKSLTDNVSPDSVLNAIWIVLLNNCEQNKPDIVKLAQSHKDTILKQEIEEDLIKELLDKGMFLNLVSTPLYSVIINYIIQQDSSSGEPISPYTVQWASDQLVNANYLAEAGNLKLLALGVPSALRGFSQSVLYVKNMFN